MLFRSDILGFCAAATKYCYSLWNVAPLSEEDYHRNEGVLADRKVNPNRVYNEPDGRLFGFNVHFNLLYDAGANPEVLYDTEIREYTGATEEEVFAQVFPGMPVSRLPEALARELRRGMKKTETGWHLRQVRRVSILGWDPKEVTGQ